MVHGVDSMGDQIACLVFLIRDEVEFEPLFCEPIIDVLNKGIKDRQHPFNGVVEWLLHWNVIHFYKKEEWDWQSKWKDCELDHMHNFHHDGNIGSFLSPKAVGYCDNSEKFLYRYVLSISSFPLFLFFNITQNKSE